MFGLLFSYSFMLNHVYNIFPLCFVQVSLLKNRVNIASGTPSRYLFWSFVFQSWLFSNFWITDFFPCMYCKLAQKMH